MCSLSKHWCLNLWCFTESLVTTCDSHQLQHNDNPDSMLQSLNNQLTSLNCCYWTRQWWWWWHYNRSDSLSSAVITRLMMKTLISSFLLKYYCCMSVRLVWWSAVTAMCRSETGHVTPLQSCVPCSTLITVSVEFQSPHSHEPVL